jgi:ATP adenylyltransferase/5',5'''-P-1,P-4-tetraphosphate phosphorylase II
MERTVSPGRSITGQRCGPSLPHKHIITVTLEVTSNTKALCVCASEVENAIYERHTLLLG